MLRNILSMIDLRSRSHQILVLGAAFLALALGAYFFLGGGAVTAPEWGNLGAASSTMARGALGTGETRVAPEGQKEFHNEQYGFSLFYPADLAVQEFDEGGGARTFVFGDQAHEKGFQIFVIPYAEEQVDRERFLKDSPSGVMQEPIDVLIDGAKGTIFFGRNSIMGDTREAWFIHGGFLYEVTTYKDLDAWLGGIMQSWQWLN